MPAGTKIDLVLSQGSESDKALVPSLETKTMREAEITLTDIGLKLGTVTYEVSTTIEKGQIIRNARIGEEVEFGTAIDIIVSSGPTEESTEASTEATSEVVSSELKLTVTIETDKFEQDTETIRIEMVQGDQISVIYEKIHAKSEGPEIVVQSVVRGTGSAKIRVYYGTVMRLEQDIQF